MYKVEYFSDLNLAILMMLIRRTSPSTSASSKTLKTRKENLQFGDVKIAEKKNKFNGQNSYFSFLRAFNFLNPVKCKGYKVRHEFELWLPSLSFEMMLLSQWKLVQEFKM